MRILKLSTGICMPFEVGVTFSLQQKQSSMRCSSNAFERCGWSCIFQNKAAFARVDDEKGRCRPALISGIRKSSGIDAARTSEDAHIACGESSQCACHCEARPALSEAFSSISTAYGAFRLRITARSFYRFQLKDARWPEARASPGRAGSSLP